MKQLIRLAIAAAIAPNIIQTPQPAIALSLACCTSLDEMEQASELIIRGKALMSADETEDLHLSRAEFQTLQSTGEGLSLGTSVVIHDGEWSYVDSYYVLPVEVQQVIKGKVEKQIIGVIQQEGWGAIPMLKDSEYLLFLYPHMGFNPEQTSYFDFYSQGKVNVDGTDTQISEVGPVGYYDTEEVEKRYGDRITFTSPPAQKTIPSTQPTTKSAEQNWLQNLFQTFRRWLNS